jgi:rare lipoprotein A
MLPMIIVRARPIALLLALALVVACSSKRPPSSAPQKGYQEKGLASWYGKPYHGRKTANGETYDMHRISAAHRTLPFGTVVKVTNLTNGRSLKVRINDRGPFVKGRIIDLSYAAAKRLQMVQDGVVRVKLVVESTP